MSRSLLSNYDGNNNQAVIRRRQVPSRRRRDGLLQFAHNQTSQNGEDGILHRLFEHLLLPLPTIDDSANSKDERILHEAIPQNPQGINLSTQPPPEAQQRRRRQRRRPRWCVDVGAWDGVHWSNTHALLVNPFKPPPHLSPTPQDSHTIEENKRRQQQQSLAMEGEKQDDSIKTKKGETRTQLDTSYYSVWKGVLVEADQEKFHQLKALHEPLGNTCLHTTVSGQEGSPQSLAILLQQLRERQLQELQGQQHREQAANESSPSSSSHSSEHNNHKDEDKNGIFGNHDVLPLDFDFLCIDIDGMDYWVLYNILVHSSFRPQVICVEFNPTMPSDLIYIPPHPSSAAPSPPRHGASLAALVELCLEHDYVLVETTLYNAFFVPFTLYQLYLSELVPDTSIEALHETTMGSTLYQLYDGTLKLWGCQKLLWHRIPIQESKIQMLTPDERVFPFAPPPPSSLLETPNKDTEYQTFLKNHTVIDMSPWCGDLLKDRCNSSDATLLVTTATKEAASMALLEELQQNDGFAHVRVPLTSSVCQAALALTKAFLQDTSESVRRSCLSAKDRARRGYSPMNTENFASLLNAKGKNDLVRKFRLGPPTPSISHPTLAEATDRGVDEKGNHHTASSSLSSSSLWQPNVWPSCEQWEEATKFQEIVQEYYRQARIAANGVVAAICHALVHQYPELQPCLGPLMMQQQQQQQHQNHEHDIDNQTSYAVSSSNLSPSDESSSVCARDSSILTLLGYRYGARHKPQQGIKKNKQQLDPLVAAHTDVGIITFLLFDQGHDCAMLQRRRRGLESDRDDDDDSWINVTLPPIVEKKDPVFVVNVADCLSELSNGRLTSALHRVVPVPLAATAPGASMTLTNEGTQQQRQQQLRNSTRNGCALFVGLDPHQQLVFRNSDNHDNNDGRTTTEQGRVSFENTTMTFEEWRKNRISRAQQALSQHQQEDNVTRHQRKLKSNAPLG